MPCSICYRSQAFLHDWCFLDPNTSPACLALQFVYKLSPEHVYERLWCHRDNACRLQELGIQQSNASSPDGAPPAYASSQTAADGAVEEAAGQGESSTTRLIIHAASSGCFAYLGGSHTMCGF